MTGVQDMGGRKKVQCKNQTRVYKVTWVTLKPLPSPLLLLFHSTGGDTEATDQRWN